MANQEIDFRIETNEGVTELVVFRPNHDPNENAAMRVQLPRDPADLQRILEGLTGGEGRFILTASTIANLVSELVE